MLLSPMFGFLLNSAAGIRREGGLVDCFLTFVQMIKRKNLVRLNNEHFKL